MLNYMLIKNKQIFFLSVLVVFGKCFCFGKISKISKTVQPFFGNLPHGSSQLQALSHELIQKVFTIHWWVIIPVAKKTQKFFQKSGFLDFSRLRLATCSQVEAPITRCTQNVSRLPYGWTFQSRKTLRQIFQILSKGSLMACFGDLFATQYSHENRMFCALRIFFKTVSKTFQFSLVYCDCSLLPVRTMSPTQTNRYTSSLPCLRMKSEESAIEA